MQDSSKDVRKKIFGREGEERVVKFLKKRGYRILERNFVTPFGEADIIARKKDVYCFVEVKARSESEAFGQPSEQVDFRKKERYRKIARFYCAQHREELYCRFDVASLGEDTLDYFEDAYC